MFIVRDGSLYEAAATIRTGDPEDEGTHEWMAAAIAILDISVDMAQQAEADEAAAD